MARPTVLWAAIALLLLGCPTAASSAGLTAEQLKTLPGLNRMVWLRVPPARRAPTLDGTLDLKGGEWADAACVAGMLGWRAQGGMLMPIPCRTYLTWDKANFYIGLRTGILPGGRLRRRERRNEGHPHRDDAIEIFFDPLRRDQAERAHYQTIFNSLGFRLDFMISAGVNAKFWDGGWTIKTDYKAGMDHWDAEIVVPVKSMFIKSPNRPGHTWRFLACRDWVGLQDVATGKKYWRIYSSITGWGAFPYPESYGGLVLDDAAPVVQLLDLDDLWDGRFGFRARLFNPTRKPIACVATAKAFFQYQEKGDRIGKHVDWSQRTSPIHEVKRAVTLKPGQELIWTVPPKELPPLGGGKGGPQWYDMVLAVKSPDGGTTYYRAQRHFRKLRYRTVVQPYELPLRVTYNPVRHNLLLWCDVLDDPNRGKARGVAVELYGIGKQPGKDKPMLATKVTDRRHDLFEGLIDVPALKEVGEYPVRAILVGDGDKPLATRDMSIEKLDEAREFKWWKCRAGIWDKPIPPHKPMKSQPRPAVVTTTMGQFTFDGSALPAQVKMTGEELLASPVRLACSVAGKPVAFRTAKAPEMGKRSAVEVNMAGRLASDKLNVQVANHMEYDGCMRFTLDIEPAGEATVDHLRLEIPFKPERGQWLWSMAQDCRASWLAVDLRKGQGVVWDSSDRTGFQMAVGTFMPQYVVSDSFRGLCWFADNDRGWVPRDDVPAAEVVRRRGETVLRFNLIGKPFVVKARRRIVFWLLGLPGRPLPAGWRVFRRDASNFGHYVGDPVVNYSAPMPRDFTKAQAFMTQGAMFNKDGSRKPTRSGKCHPDFEFAPWHDTHNWFRTPDTNPKTFSYFALEGRGGSMTPTMNDYRCYLWNEYVRRTDLAGVYFDTPEAMGFSFNLSNGVAYVIPDGQPGAGNVQPGYTIAGFREYVKRVRGIFAAHGRPTPWLEMHATHGPVAPCTPFLDVRTDGEHYRTPNYRNFAHAWPARHFRALDIPPLFGIATRWLGGYPWDGKIPDVDPVRCKIGTLALHDIFSGWGDFNRRRSPWKGDLACTRGPLLGHKTGYVNQKLVAHGMNGRDVVYHPYWLNKGLLTLAGRDGEAVEAVEKVLGSVWHIPSQSKALVAVTNFRESPVKGVTVKLNLETLGLAPKDGERLVVVDFETGEPLAQPLALDFPPLDFWLLMFARAKVAPDAPAARLPIQPAKDREGRPVISAESLRRDLMAHGLAAPDVKHYGPDPPPGPVTLSAKGAEGVRVELFHSPSQHKALVALTNRTKRRADVSVALDLETLDLAGAQKNLLVLDLRTGAVLQETVLRAWGRRFARSSPSRELGKVRVTIPGNETALVLFAEE